jgi:hypothetical protein
MTPPSALPMRRTSNSTALHRASIGSSGSASRSSTGSISGLTAAEVPVQPGNPAQAAQHSTATVGLHGAGARESAAETSVSSHAGTQHLRHEVGATSHTADEATHPSQPAQVVVSESQEASGMSPGNSVSFGNHGHELAEAQAAKSPGTGRRSSRSVACQQQREDLQPEASFGAAPSGLGPEPSFGRPAAAGAQSSLESDAETQQRPAAAAEDKQPHTPPLPGSRLLHAAALRNSEAALQSKDAAPTAVSSQQPSAEVVPAGSGITSAPATAQQVPAPARPGPPTQPVVQEHDTWESATAGPLIAALQAAAARGSQHVSDSQAEWSDMTLPSPRGGARSPRGGFPLRPTAADGSPVAVSRLRHTSGVAQQGHNNASVTSPLPLSPRSPSLLALAAPVSPPRNSTLMPASSPAKLIPKSPLTDALRNSPAMKAGRRLTAADVAATAAAVAAAGGTRPAAARLLGVGLEGDRKSSAHASVSSPAPITRALVQQAPAEQVTPVLRGRPTSSQGHEASFATMATPPSAVSSHPVNFDSWSCSSSDGDADEEREMPETPGE